MMATGKMTKLMALEYTVILMVHAIRDIGKRISSMDRALRPGQMVQVTKATM